MSSFLVVDRASRRIRHEAASLAEARGYCECRRKPSAVAILVDAFIRIETQFVVQVVRLETGLVLCQSHPMDIDEATDELLGSKLTLVPASMARKAVTP